jgi:hypothetical protein
MVGIGVVPVGLHVCMSIRMGVCMYEYDYPITI